MRKILIMILVMLMLSFVLTGCQQNQITANWDDKGCLTNEGYSMDTDVGACTRSGELDEYEKEVAKTVIMVQSYSSFTIVSVDKNPICDDCYDVTLKRNPVNEETKDEKFLHPYVIPYREGRIDYTYDEKIGETKDLRNVCTVDEINAEICNMVYNPVCGEIGLNMGDTTYKTFSNACSACSSMKVLAYLPGDCEDLQFVVCTETVIGFDPVEFAKDTGGICVEQCPEGFDQFMTQIGIQMCISHYGLTEIEQWSICEKSTESCNCVKAYETTDELQITDAQYRCAPEKYSSRLLFRGGVDSLDENGERSVMIA